MRLMMQCGCCGQRFVVTAVPSARPDAALGRLLCLATVVRSYLDRLRGTFRRSRDVLTFLAHELQIRAAPHVTQNTPCHTSVAQSSSSSSSSLASTTTSSSTAVASLSLLPIVLRIFKLQVTNYRSLLPSVPSHLPVSSNFPFAKTPCSYDLAIRRLISAEKRRENVNKSALILSAFENRLKAGVLV